MSPENRTKANIGVGVGTLLQIAGFFLSQSYGIRPVLGLALILISIPVFIWGCMNYAEGKGHLKWVGLIGIAGLIGLITLVILPDQQDCSSLHRALPPGRQHGSSAHRLQVRKLVGLVSLLLGLALVISGRYFDDLEYADVYRMQAVPLEHPWPGVLMFTGVCLIICSLILMLAHGSHAANGQTEAPAKEDHQ